MSSSVTKDSDGFISNVVDLTDKLEDADLQERESKAKHSELIQSSYEVMVTLADQQADPNSPLYSVKTFEEVGLTPELLKGLYAMGFTRPSKIQERALPLLLAEPPKNMIGQSQSGTGKTAAFVLAMLSRVDTTKAVPQAICLAPVRELARQIMSVVQQMGQFTNITTAYAIPEAENGSKITQHVVVGTPGKMQDLIRKKILDPTTVKIFVLDEADNMLDQQGLGDQTLRVKNFMPKFCQILLFSATFPDVVRKFAIKFAPNSNQIALKKEELSVEGIKQFLLDCKNEAEKFDVLVRLYELLTIGQSIIFCKRRETADHIAARMVAEGHQVASLHGSKDVKERDQIIDDFRDGKSKVLITTNVIARGIDILQVNMVVNYDMPMLHGDSKVDIETYLHRIGRTGRFGRKGISVNFVHNTFTWQLIEDIERELHVTIVKVPTSDVDEMDKVGSHCIIATRETELSQTLRNALKAT
ncbi:DEAD-domain-containing protein [Auriculariales sp. MPI-PUGE-AT-0066]|nr:DEAD-domain-containing protein [Auriculariales sp. MPI-PUGE-AT-0066]